MNIPKALKRIGLFIAVILALYLICELFCVIMSVNNYNNTDMPDDLTAEQTLEKYFEYWDRGNLYGIALIRDDPLPGKLDSFSWYYFADNIVLDNYRYIGVPASFTERSGYYEGKVFFAEYSKSFDDGWTGVSSGYNDMEFVMCRKDEDSPWRLCAVGGLYAD